MPQGERPLGGEDSELVRFAADLRRLRARAGTPSYRELARRAHYSSTTLSDAAGGRRLPTLAVVLGFVRACGGDVVEWERRWREVAVDGGEVHEAPYSGLASLGVEDSDRFFGRAGLVDEVVGRLGRTAFLAVVGASGVGKSSLLRAGLVARLRARGLDGARDVAAVVMTPGAQPVAALMESLAGHGDERDVVVVVDQFEEVFTLCHDVGERGRFVAGLMRAVRAGTRVVIGLRTDFLAHCADFPELRVAMGDAQVLVGAMTPEELRQVVVEPAARAGCTVEGELVAAIVAGATGRAAALPLVSHALLETWRRSRDDVLTLADYRAVGGIEEALAQTAERVYGELGPPRQRLARGLFLRLTALGEGTEDTKRRISRDELDADAPEVRATLDVLAGARLVTLDQDTVELTHEALISAWPRLHHWLAADRDDLRTHRRLTEAARTWQVLGEDPGALYRGAQLEIVREWGARDGHREQLNSRERAFLDASVDAEARERRSRARRDLQLRILVLGLVVLLAVVTGVTFVAVEQRQQAVAARQTAVSRQVATQAQALAGSRPDTAMLLSVQAYRTAPTAEARSTLLGMSARSAYQGAFTAHRGAVSEMSFTPDGRTLVTASGDSTIGVWDVRRRAKSASLDEHRTPLRTLAMSPDGSVMASGGDDHRVVLWHVASRVRIAELSGHGAEVKEIAFSPDGRLLATGAADDQAIVWDVARRTPLAHLTGHGGEVQGLAFSPDGLLATAGSGHTVLLWDIASATVVRTLVGHTDVVKDLAFSPDGRVLASTGWDSTIRLWNMPDGTRRTTLTGHTGSVIALAFNADGTLLASAGNDTDVRLWDVAHGSPRARLTGHTGSVYALAFGSGPVLASAGESGSVILWDTELAPLAEPEPTGAGDLVFSPNGAVLAEAAGNRTTLWDPGTRSRRAVLTERSVVNAVAFSPDNTVLATANQDGTTTLWDVPGGREVARVGGHTGDVLDVAFSPDGHTFVTAGADQRTIVRDLASRAERAVLTSQTGVINGVAFSPDGRTLVTTSHDSSVVLWETADWTPRVRLSGHSGWVRSAVFSPDNRMVATASADSTVRLWDAETGSPRATVTGHVDAVFNGAAFSPDGATLAYATGEHTVSLWDVKQQTVVARLPGHTKPVHAVAFSPDGRTLVSTGADDAVLFWDTDAERVAQHICDTLGREPTDDEWREFIPDLPRKQTC
ncbi:nSTAND1 domain-containing NTPase [Saccharothrix obliqua]|uniref:nSTAND1 domain-containing NTPase n=1 Tax=Saccharothrix obliqua TaxID=2861747 RepID=UPI001C5D2853|nr:hypothetical protein [Saccharothrix obliqua]MBW4721564.1 hypothetical protein [Saccharothrix obliqua]